ncbi:glycosyltransferase WbuB [Cryobacterium sp. TMS1-20-1]|uniref:glycosyltransferase family 4 protein n=1 Tax=Cryobacterium sp. TMS1-20-1 TaxID=1259223 RepID=UPI00106BBEE0|nr:glycosyltransferase family 4 protein [Cryobacterium sp. TMS1-20-1]TFC70740.1 glycosyltransferase WbuB [Cryobacterium sp. TMS1-20-1]
MKILIVTQYYPPEFAVIQSTLAQQLSERGHEVRVLTGFPSYPHGKLYAGFKQSWHHTESHGRVLIRRVPLIINHSQNSLARIANYLSFALSTLLASGFARNVDVVYVYATQMTAAIAPHFWRRTLRIPFVLHVQDLWPESITDSSLIKSSVLGRVMSAILAPFLSAVYKQSSAVIPIAPTMRDLLADRGVDEKKLHTVYNWAEDSDDLTTATRVIRPTGGVCVTYAGNLGDLQDLETVLEAARLVLDLVGFRLVLVGTGVAERSLRQQAAEKSLTNVEFRGRVPPKEMNLIYAESDFQLVTLKDIPIFRGTIPSKFQGSLARGVAIIATVAGDVTAIVQDEGVGLTAPPENPVALADAFRAAYFMPDKARAELGRRGRALYLRSMSAQAGVDAIETILTEAASEITK